MEKGALNLSLFFKQPSHVFLFFFLLTPELDDLFLTLFLFL